MEPINSYVEDLFKTQTSNGATIYTDVKDILTTKEGDILVFGNGWTKANDHPIDGKHLGSYIVSINQYGALNWGTTRQSHTYTSYQQEGLSISESGLIAFATGNGIEIL